MYQVIAPEEAWSLYHAEWQGIVTQLHQAWQAVDEGSAIANRFLPPDEINSRRTACIITLHIQPIIGLMMAQCHRVRLKAIGATHLREGATREY